MVDPALRRSGNRCGHDPRFLRLDLVDPPQAGRVPDTLLLISAIIIKRFSSWRTTPRAFRWLRSERREGIALALASMIKHADLVTRRIGFPTRETADGWAGLDMERIAREAGITVGRAARAMADLVMCGYIHKNGQPREKYDSPDGPRWRGHAARRQIMPALLDELGVLVTWRIAADKAAKRRREERRRSGAPAAPVVRAWRGQVRSSAPSAERPKRERSPIDIAQDELVRERPEIAHDPVALWNAALARLLRPPPGSN